MNRSIEKLRYEYGKAPLEETGLHPNPIKQFTRWLKEALRAEVMEPNGMTLCTVSNVQLPSSRTVLLKNVSEQGFYFYTNYSSRKGEHLKLHPYASLTFWWKEIYRQVNIEGRVKKVTRKESTAYFHKRPRGAQLAAVASAQSTSLASRDELEEAFERQQKKYRGKKIPCPMHWGGYYLVPERIEFWQGCQNRLHDRFVYIKTNGGWIFSRLSP